MLRPGSNLCRSIVVFFLFHGGKISVKRIERRDGFSELTDHPGGRYGSRGVRHYATKQIHSQRAKRDEWQCSASALESIQSPRPPGGPRVVKVCFPSSVNLI